MKKNKIKSFVKDLLWMDTKNLDKLTVFHLEQKMIEKQFDNEFIKELLCVFEQRICNHGEKHFQQWLSNLHFKCPDEFKEEEKAIQVYDNYYSWLEAEVNKLENETKLSWEVQTEDIQELDAKGRKTQLVIRTRLSEIVLEMI